MLNGVPIASTECGKELDQLLVFTLNFAQVDELFNDGWSDLFLQQLLVITEQFLDRALSEDIVILVSLHSLHEEEVDPLRGIHLVNLVASHSALQKDISILAQAGDQVLLSDSH